MTAAAFLALLVIAMMMLSGLRLELNYRRGQKVAAGPGPASPVERPTVPRPSLRRVPDPYSD
jgi:hypothetical protein